MNNNLNLIRLVAAFQVAICHGVKHFSLESNPFFSLLYELLKPFPGVPIFFAISGFLILKSYRSRINDQFSFWQSRTLRLFPALICCSLFVLFILFLQKFPIKDLLVWFIGQITILQFYTPNSLRSWGVGCPNGSLWTICVEIQFYLTIPIIFHLLKNKSFRLPILLLLFTGSYLFCIWTGTLSSELLLSKLLDVTIFTYLFYFLFGVILFEYWSFWKPLLENKAIIWFLAYILFIILMNTFNVHFITYKPDFVGLIGYSLLILSVFSIAYTKPSISSKLIGDTDLSYGIYLWHMPIINILYHLSIPLYYKVSLWFILLILFSAISWFFIEKKALKLKLGNNEFIKNPIR